MCLPSKTIRIRRIIASQLERTVLQDKKGTGRTRRTEQRDVGEQASDLTSLHQSPSKSNSPIQSQLEDTAKIIDGSESPVQVKDAEPNQLDIKKAVTLNNEEIRNIELQGHSQDNASYSRTRRRSMKKRPRSDDGEPRLDFMQLPVKKRPIEYHNIIQHEISAKRFLVGSSSLNDK